MAKKIVKIASKCGPVCRTKKAVKVAHKKVKSAGKKAVGVVKRNPKKSAAIAGAAAAAIGAGVAAVLARKKLGRKKSHKKKESGISESKENTPDHDDLFI